MPRQPRIEAPGLIYHVMARGIEQQDIFMDGLDYRSFMDRLGEIARGHDCVMHAFCLMPNHVHLLLQRQTVPLSTFMRKLLTGHAVFFNKRHGRKGHLFQNRYKALICREESYLLELIRYIHLNPLRANLVRSLSELEDYRYSGHGSLLGRFRLAGFDPHGTLALFGANTEQACRTYRGFVADGVGIELNNQPEPSDNDKGVLRLDYDGPSLPERPILASAVRQTTSGRPGGNQRTCDLPALISAMSEEYAISAAELRGHSRRRIVAEVRSILVRRMSAELGMTGREIAGELGLTEGRVSRLLAKANNPSDLRN